MSSVVSKLHSPIDSRFAVRAVRQLVLLPFVLFCCIAACHAEPKARLIELKADTTTYLGKIVARSETHCFVMDRFGVMSNLPLDRLGSVKVIAENYRPSPSSDFRKQLQSEFRTGYEIQNSAHYVVVGKRGRAKAYVTLFEEIYRQVESFYSLRGFDAQAPEFTLVAIILGTQDEFKEYCGRDEVLWSKELRGYYSLKTNRVVLYDDPDLLNSVTSTSAGHDSGVPFMSAGELTGVSGVASDPTVFAALLNRVAGETADTIVHEATHQVGYNIGIHSRIGESPAWVIEGLATVLEAPGVRTREKSTAADKINAERLDWFREEYGNRRKHGDLARMIADDDMFRNQSLDAYSNAWAFAYFMTETPARARLFMRYLKKLSERDCLAAYTASDRLADFQSVFGDIARVEVEFLRFMDRVEAP